MIIFKILSFEVGCRRGKDTDEAGFLRRIFPKVSGITA
jgi:hypothetical protein